MLHHVIISHSALQHPPPHVCLPLAFSSSKIASSLPRVSLALPLLYSHIFSPPLASTSTSLFIRLYFVYSYLASAPAVLSCLMLVCLYSVFPILALSSDTSHVHELPPVFRTYLLQSTYYLYPSPPPFLPPAVKYRCLLSVRTQCMRLPGFLSPLVLLPPSEFHVKSETCMT